MKIDESTTQRFTAMAAPYLDAAYNLARWLTRHPQDAEDVVQEAYLRAFRFFDAFRGGDGRAWLLTIVRHTAYTWLRQNRPDDRHVEFTQDDAGLHFQAGDDPPLHAMDPQALLLREADRRRVEDGLRRLAPEVREVLVLRELEALSYKDIAQIAAIPIGTVMSRLSRGREQLRRVLDQMEARP